MVLTDGWVSLLRLIDGLREVATTWPAAACRADAIAYAENRTGRTTPHAMRSTMMPNGSFYLRLVLLVCFLVARDGWAWSPGTSQRDATAGFTVNRTDRRDVLAFHNTGYNASDG
jgi:hypothetical protein